MIFRIFLMMAAVLSGGNVYAADNVAGGAVAAAEATPERRYAVGDEVYFNPYQGTPCRAEEAWSRDNLASRCFRWYVLHTDGETLELIADHDVGRRVPWLSKEDFIAAGGTAEEYGERGNSRYGPLTALKELKRVTNSFKNVEVLTAADNVTRPNAEGGSYTINYAGFKARLPSAQEFADLVPDKNTVAGTIWSPDTPSFIHAMPYWLYANLGRPDGNPEAVHVAQYTDTAHTVLPSTVWVVCLGTNLGKGSVTTHEKYGRELLGVRPIIRLKGIFL